jgi:hypothetical protein
MYITPPPAAFHPLPPLPRILAPLADVALLAVYLGVSDFGRFRPVLDSRAFILVSRGRQEATGRATGSLRISL